MDKVLTGGVVVALVLSGLAFFSAPSETVTERVIERVGAQVGPEHYEKQYFYGGFVSGGTGTKLSTTTVDANRTLGVTDLDDETYIEFTPTVGAITITIPATTTAGFSSVVGNEVGSEKRILLYNATTTTGAASVITWAAGTGIDLQEDEGETVLQNGLELFELVLVRKQDSDVAAWIRAGQVGD